MALDREAHTRETAWISWLDIERLHMAGVGKDSLITRLNNRAAVTHKYCDLTAVFGADQRTLLIYSHIFHTHKQYEVMNPVLHNVL